MERKKHLLLFLRSGFVADCSGKPEIVGESEIIGIGGVFASSRTGALENERLSVFIQSIIAISFYCGEK